MWSLKRTEFSKWSAWEPLPVASEVEKRTDIALEGKASFESEWVLWIRCTVELIQLLILLVPCWRLQKACRWSSLSMYTHKHKNHTILCSHIQAYTVHMYIDSEFRHTHIHTNVTKYDDGRFDELGYCSLYNIYVSIS